MTEFTFTFWSWFGLIGNLATAAMSLALLLVIVGVVRPATRGGPYWHRSNFWLAMFLLSLFGQVTSGQFTNFLFWLEQGDPLLSFSVSLLFFGAGGILLFAFISQFLGLQGRAFWVPLIVGFVVWLAVAIFTLKGMVITDIWLNEVGLLRYNITPLGYALSTLPFVYQFAALGLLLYRRKQLLEELPKRGNLFTLGVGALVIGPLLVVLRVERLLGVAIPYTAIGPLVGLAIIGHTLIRRQVFDPLRRLTFELEHQVAERTRELEQASEDMRRANEALNRRAKQLQATINITREAAASLNLDQMLPRVVELMHRHWDLFCAALYLVDDRGEWAVLQAATGQGAAQLKKVAHRVRVGADLPVGYVTARGEPRLAFQLAGLEMSKITNKGEEDPLTPLAYPSLDLGESHMLLPGARSALTLPLKVANQVIGALDLQSAEDGFVAEEDVAVLQTLADHLALAIENARLLRRTETQLNEVTTLYRRYRQQLWQTLPGRLAVTYRHGQLHLERDAEGTGSDSLSGKEGLFTVPIKLHGEIIGLLGFRKGETDGGWSADEKALVETVVSQMALALENARLLEEARRRAQREQWIGEIGGRIRATVDRDAIMQTAVRELGRVLRASEGLIRLGTPDQLMAARSNGGGGLSPPSVDPGGQKGEEVGP